MSNIPYELRSRRRGKKISKGIAVLTLAALATGYFFRDRIEYFLQTKLESLEAFIQSQKNSLVKFTIREENGHYFADIAGRTYKLLEDVCSFRLEPLLRKHNPNMDSRGLTGLLTEAAMHLYSSGIGSLENLKGIKRGEIFYDRILAKLPPCDGRKILVPRLYEPGREQKSLNPRRAYASL